MQTSVDRFCMRQFTEEFAGGANFHGVATPEDLVKLVEPYVKDKKPGYAPFAFRVIVPNPHPEIFSTIVRRDSVPPTAVRTAYERRRPHQLPVLVEYAPLVIDKPLPRADFLVFELYTREKIRQENADEGKPDDGHTEPFGIITIKAQDFEEEIPMTPVTMMRNALGTAFGGSGAPLNAAAYEASVKFWSEHVALRVVT